MQAGMVQEIEMLQGIVQKDMKFTPSLMSRFKLLTNVEIDRICRVHLPLLQDPNVTPEQAFAAIQRAKVVENGPALPPKLRLKQKPQSPLTFRILPMVPQENGTPPSNYAPHNGEIVAIIHPQLPASLFGRVLANAGKEGEHLFLVAFLLIEHPPCYVPNSYIYPLDYNKRIVRSDDEFNAYLNESVHTVDSLVEKILVISQSQVMSHRECLYPIDALNHSGTIPSEAQIQHTIKQNTCYCALLNFAYIYHNWNLPEEKKEMIINAISCSSVCRSDETRAHFKRCLELIKHLTTLP